MPPSHRVTTTGLHYPQALSQTSLLSPRLRWICLPSPPSGAGRGVPPAAASACGTLRARCHSLGEASWKIILLPATRGLAATQASAHRAISIGLPSSTTFALLPVTKTRVSSSALPCAFTARRGHTQQVSLLLQWTPELGVTQTCAKDKPTILPDEEEADEASSVLLNSSVSLLVSSLDMLMAVI